LQGLKAAGYLLGVITNRPKPIHGEIHTLGLDTVLDFYLTAGQLGAFKPHRQIFDNVLKFISGTPEQLLYVGDNYYADVLGARNAGIQAVLLNWHGLYTDLDCPEIKQLSDLQALLQLQTA
jgi:putative hydrolase of the HAD superfamily